MHENKTPASDDKAYTGDGDGEGEEESEGQHSGVGSTFGCTIDHCWVSPELARSQYTQHESYVIALAVRTQ